MLGLIVLQLGEAVMIVTPLIAHLIYVHVQLNSLHNDIVLLKKHAGIRCDGK